jgi:outer membrane protein assembly factor BamA
MKVWGIIIILLLPWPAAGQQQYYGATASAVHLAEPADSTDLQRIPIRVGDVITVENVRQSLQALYDTGRYRYVEVDAILDGNGVALTFRVERNYFFSTFTLEPPDIAGGLSFCLFSDPPGREIFHC